LEQIKKDEIMAEINSELDSLFNPRSVAVIGASGSLNKIGAMTLLSIIGGGFKGKIYPINPAEEEILGLKVYTTLKEVPDNVDLAIICVSAALVSQVVKECAEAGVKFGIVISSGFSEVSEEGKKLEKEIVEIARKGGMRIIGPNCMGMASAEVNFYALINMLIPRAGNVSVVSQSGTLCSLAMMAASEQSIGFSRFISSGNEADLHSEDFIEYFAHDPQTKVILAFIEGVRDGQKFFRVAKEASRNKPLIVLKAGVTEAGAKAASSHTGSITGSTLVYDALFRQTRIIPAKDERDMVDLIKAFSLSSLPKGRKVGIVTAWGGYGVLTSDACAREGLEVPEFSQETMEWLNQFLPPFWSHGNPIDLTAAGLFGDFATQLLKSTEVLLDDDNIDAVICTVPAFASLLEKVAPRMEPGVLQDFSRTSMASMIPLEGGIAEDIVKLKEKYAKPIIGVVIGFYEQNESESIRFLENNGIPLYQMPHQAARALSKLADYSNHGV
jgi:acetyl coenzyme A synthetase (ADP forming)-like protein